MWRDLEMKLTLPTAAEALPGRDAAIAIENRHFVTGRPLLPPYPKGLALAQFGMGCFWGAERCFWSRDGVWVTAVGYAGGLTPNPTYREVCTGLTGHNEVVRVVFDPVRVSYEDLLAIFWEHHDPTQGMRQGNDIGTQYRSEIHVIDEAQRLAALRSRDAYQQALQRAGHGQITTAIVDAPRFYYAEDYHQQYLAKEPGGYCGLGGTGVACPGLSATTRVS